VPIRIRGDADGACSSLPAFNTSTRDVPPGTPPFLGRPLFMRLRIPGRQGTLDGPNHRSKDDMWTRRRAATDTNHEESECMACCALGESSTRGLPHTCAPTRSIGRGALGQSTTKPLKMKVQVLCFIIKTSDHHRCRRRERSPARSQPTSVCTHVGGVPREQKESSQGENRTKPKV
jgi:hypothetical protein